MSVATMIPHSVKVAAAGLALGYIGLVLLLAAVQRRLIYHPSRGTSDELLPLAAREGLTPWNLPNGEFSGWRLPPRSTASSNASASAQLALVFHGNAGQAMDRTYLARGIQSMPGYWDVFLFEYPGYGMRTGSPSEKAILAAASDAFEALSAGGQAVHLVGESLGSGPAAILAGRHPGRTAGLILLTPFTSLTDVARHHYPAFPIGWLLRDRYDGAAALAHYPGPAAFLLAEHDEVVSYRLGRQLHDRFNGRKKLWTQPRSHNELDYTPGNATWMELAAFLLAN